MYSRGNTEMKSLLLLLLLLLLKSWGGPNEKEHGMNGVGSISVFLMLTVFNNTY